MAARNKPGNKHDDHSVEVILDYFILKHVNYLKNCFLC